MPAATKNIEIDQGSLFLKRFQIDDPNLAALDLSNYVFRLTMRESFGGTTIKEFVEDSHLIVNKLTAGYILLELTAVETAALDFTRGVYDLEAVPVTASALGFTGSFNSLDIDVDNGSGLGEFTANHGDAAFDTRPVGDVLVAGDHIRLAGAESAANLGTYILNASPSSTLITVTGLILGTDNAADTAGVISKLVLDEANVIRLMSGRVALNKQATT